MPTPADDFKKFQNEQLQTDHLDEIKDSIETLVRLEQKNATFDVSGSPDSSQSTVQQAIGSTGAGMDWGSVHQQAYAKFESDLRGISSKVDRLGTAAVGGAALAATSIGGMSDQAFGVGNQIPSAGGSYETTFGTPRGYAQAYKSTFWRDLWDQPGIFNVGFERAPQTMYQGDFQQQARENFQSRMTGLMSAPMLLIGADPSIAEAETQGIMDTSHEFMRFGQSQSFRGTGFTRRQARTVAEDLYNTSITDLGASHGQYMTAYHMFAQGGQFNRMSGTGDVASAVKEGMTEALSLMKQGEMGLEETIGYMNQFRQSLGITDMQAQADLVSRSIALSQVSGMTLQETIGGAVQGASMVRGTGYNVALGGVLNQGNMAAISNAYQGGALSENRIQQAGGINNLAASLTQASVGFATRGAGQFYYAAASGGYNGGDINQTAMAASSAMGSIQGYSNFKAQQDRMYSNTNTLAFQRTYLTQMFEQMQGYQPDMTSEDDKNVLAMLAMNSGQFGDANTAKAFVEMNFTEQGRMSQMQTRRDTLAAENMADRKRGYDLAYQEESFAGGYHSIQTGFRRGLSEAGMSVRRGIDDFMFGGEGADISKRDREILLGVQGAGRLTDYGKERIMAGGGTVDYSGVGQYMGGLYDFNSQGAWGRGVGGAVTGFAAGGTVSAIAAGGLFLGGAALSLTGIGAGVGGMMMGAALPTLLTGGAIASAGGAVAGGIYGASTSGNMAVPKALSSNYYDIASAVNTGSSLSVLDKNALNDSETRMGIVDAYLGSNNKLISQYRINSGNQNDIAAGIRNTAEKLGVSEDVVVKALQQEGIIEGTMDKGSAQLLGNENIGKMWTELATDFFDADTEGFSKFSEDTSALGSFTSILEMASEGTYDKVAAARAFKSFVSGAEEAGLDTNVVSMIRDYVETGDSSKLQDNDYFGTDVTLSEIATYSRLRTDQVINRRGVEQMSGAIAERSDFYRSRGNLSLARTIEGIGNAKTIEGIVGSLRGKLSDAGFRSQVREDEVFKRMVQTYEADIDQSDFLSLDKFHSEFGFKTSEEELEKLRSAFESGGSEGVRDRLIRGELLRTGMAGDGGVGPGGKGVEAILADAADTIKAAAETLKTIS